MVTRSNSVDMVNGPLWNKILKFTLTYMLTAVLQQLYSAADVMVVGRFAGKEALAGVGTCSVLVNLFLNFIMGLAAGVTIVLGQEIGRSRGDAKNDGVSQVSHTAIALAIYCGLAITAVCLFFATPLLNLISVPEDVMSEAKIYLRVMALGYVPSLIYNFGAGILRAKGDTKRPLYIVLASGIINVVLNLLFVCGFKMTASGVAAATVISKVFNAVVVLYVLCNENDATRINLKKIHIYKMPFLRILKLGIPSGVQSGVYSFSNIIVQSSVNGFGAAAIAGSAATASITNFYNVMVNSLYQASIVFVSQNYGAKKFNRIKKTIVVCMVYVVCIWAMQSIITARIGRLLIGLYTSDAAAIEMGWRKFSIVGYTYGLLGIMNIMSGALRGMGASFLNMIMSIVGVCGIRILWILTVFKSIGTFESLYACYPVSWSGTMILHFIMFMIVFRNAKRQCF